MDKIVLEHVSYIYNAGSNVGAYNGKPTSFIQLKVTSQGEIHIHPVTR